MLEILAAVIGIVGGVFGASEYLKRIRYLRIRITRRDDALLKNRARVLVLRIEKDKNLKNANFDDKKVRDDLLKALETSQNWTVIEPNSGNYWQLEHPGRYLIISRLYVKDVFGDVSGIINIFVAVDTERGYEYQYEMRESRDRFGVFALGRHKLE